MGSQLGSAFIRALLEFQAPVSDVAVVTSAMTNANGICFRSPVGAGALLFAAPDTMASGKASTSVDGHAVVSTFRPVPVLMAMPVPAPFTIVSVNWLGVHSDASRVSSSCRQYAVVLIFLSQPEWFKLRSQLISSLLGLPLRLSLEKAHFWQRRSGSSVRL